MNGPGRPGRARVGAVLLAFALGLSACALPPHRFRDAPPTAVVVLNVVDERGNPVAEAQVEVIDTHGQRRISQHRTDLSGAVRLSLSDPVVVVVSSEGHLDEPVVVGPDDNGLSVALWDRLGADGRPRISLHFGGDVMLGRRYLDPDRPTAWAHDDASARRIVRHLAPLAERADFTAVNLETVVGDVADEPVAAGKRFPIGSPAFALAMLDELGVDLVALGNNHVYDWGDEGLETTLALLDESGIGHVGAGFTAADAVRGRLDEVAGLRVGTISVSTLSGDFVNDQLPTDDDAEPDDLSEADAWKYERRRFGYDADGIRLAPGERRIGEVWRWFREVERGLTPEAVAELWAALTSVSPELQDWVARRGHGGAAHYRAEEVAAEIARLRADGADLVVLQLHAGFQFAEVASSFVDQVARRAVDAGADLVVGHHPHVLQGVEWYRDRLIVPSLGNLVFDQDFAATFPSALLRVVTDGKSILEARFFPVFLDRYRPKPVAGPSATRIIRSIDERSALSAQSRRADDRRIVTVVTELDRAETSLQRHGNAAVVRADRGVDRWQAELTGGEVAMLPECTLVRADLLPDGVQVGADRFGWGHFGDDAVSGLARRTDGADRRLPLMWRVHRDPARWDVLPGPSSRFGDRSLRLHTDPNAATSTGFLAQLDLAAHRLFDGSGSPVDTPAELTVTLSARRDRGETPVVRLSTFAFDDTDPTSAPTTERLATIELPLDLPDDGRWHDLELALPAALLEPDAQGRTANKMSLLVEAPPALFGVLDLDDVRVFEWRGRASSDVPVWIGVDAVRSAHDGEIELVTSHC